MKSRVGRGNNTREQFNHRMISMRKLRLFSVCDILFTIEWDSWRQRAGQICCLLQLHWRGMKQLSSTFDLTAGKKMLNLNHLILK